MNFSQIFFIFLCVASTMGDTDTSKDKPSIDLDDYIDTGSTNPKSKGEDLGTSETGYYGYAPQPVYHGHALGHSHHAHAHAVPVHHHVAVAPEVHYSHDHHNHYAHVPYDAGHDHSTSYYDGTYGGHGVLGHGHVSTAHVSYGTNINHGSYHYHNPHGTYHR